jgi:putative Mg2+ transporter-C (MgtC) family protein
MRSEIELLVRLVAAAVFTGAIGWERETAGKAAGLRTHVLVGVAACLFVTLGISVSGDFGGTNVRIEPFSLIQAVAVGVGFLGSGVVRLGQGNRPHGLTTAASIWAAAGIGLGAGFGKYILAGGATVILLIVLRGVEQLEHRYQARKNGETLVRPE